MSLVSDGRTEVLWITGRQEKRRSALVFEKEEKRGMWRSCICKSYTCTFLGSTAIGKGCMNRLLLYASNGFKSGHVSRCLGISRRFGVVVFERTPGTPKSAVPSSDGRRPSGL